MATTQFRICQSPHGVLVDWTDAIDGDMRFVGDPDSAGRVRIEFRTLRATDATPAVGAGMGLSATLPALQDAKGSRVELEFASPQRGAQGAQAAPRVSECWCGCQGNTEDHNLAGRGRR